jgi:hypothetical protein
MRLPPCLSHISDLADLHCPRRRDSSHSFTGDGVEDDESLMTRCPDDRAPSQAHARVRQHLSAAPPSSLWTLKVPVSKIIAARRRTSVLTFGRHPSGPITCSLAHLLHRPFAFIEGILTPILSCRSAPHVTNMHRLTFEKQRPNRMEPQAVDRATFVLPFQNVVRRPLLMTTRLNFTACLCTSHYSAEDPRNSTSAQDHGHEAQRQEGSAPGISCASRMHRPALRAILLFRPCVTLGVRLCTDVQLIQPYRKLFSCSDVPASRSPSIRQRDYQAPLSTQLHRRSASHR